MSTTTLESCKISPPADTPPEFSLPILFFDMLFYDFAANRAVHFFELPYDCSKSQFLDTIVPQLKTSLSLTLTHFLPLAGNIIHPKEVDKNPLIRYQSGDSVSLTISESDADFNHLTGDHPRVCDDFYAFNPHIPPATHSEYSVSCPVMAIQVTLFPGKGLSIGSVIHHAIADASTGASFLQAWALINRRNRIQSDYITISIDDELKQNNCLPFYDRKAVANLNGLDSLYWDLIVQFGFSVEPQPEKFLVNKHRATFVLKKEEIQKLKNLVSVTCPGMTHVSSFTIVSALVWVCSSKADRKDDVADDDLEYFGFAADCRGRINPPLPANYFGNCVALVNAVLKHGEVMKGNKDGFVMAAKAIDETIKEKVYNEKGILHDAKNWLSKNEKIIRKRQYGVAGSPRFDFYAVDYGWGRAKKFEVLSIDGAGDSISLCKSREFEGGLEIGVSKPMPQIQAFATIFKEFLADLLE